MWLTINVYQLITIFSTFYCRQFASYDFAALTISDSCYHVGFQFNISQRHARDSFLAPGRRHGIQVAAARCGGGVKQGPSIELGSKPWVFNGLFNGNLSIIVD